MFGHHGLSIAEHPIRRACRQLGLSGGVTSFIVASCRALCWNVHCVPIGRSESIASAIFSTPIGATRTAVVVSRANHINDVVNPFARVRSENRKQDLTPAKRSPCGDHPGRRAFGECALAQAGGIVPKMATASCRRGAQFALANIGNKDRGRDGCYQPPPAQIRT